MVAGAARPNFSYRPEIDGIRALSVLAVVVNHFNKDVLPSGYLGVDIFFVLSGFVISLSIANRSSQDIRDFLTGFYVRRIKRLVPALLLFITVNSVLICFFNPDPRDSLETGISALFGLSNLYLFRDATDYFAASTELNIFTHTWSLGIEEQFYLFFPLVVWMTGFGRSSEQGNRNLFAVTLVLCMASLLVFANLYSRNESAAYFLMPTRLWELCAGCLLFVVLQWRDSWLGWFKHAPPLLIISVLTAVLFVPNQFAIATTIAIVILSTVLLICLRPKTPVYRLLTHPKVVYVGRLSYSLYLWHWSVLCLSRWTVGIHWWSVPFQGVLMFLLAAASYKYVENPLRHLRWAKLRWQTIAKGVAASAILASALAVGMKMPQLYGAYLGDRPNMEAIGVASLTEEYVFEGDEWGGYKCVLWGDSRVGKEVSTRNCTLGDFSRADRRVLVLGDSFSAAFTQSFDRLVAADNYAVTLVSAFGTSPVKTIPTQETTDAINNYYWGEVVPGLVGQLEPEDWVLLINNLGGLSRKSPVLDVEEKLLRLEEGFGRISDWLSEKDIRLAVLHGLPFASEPNCQPAIAAKQWFSPFGGPCEFPSRQAALSQRDALDAVLSALESQGKLAVVDLFDVYCPENQCTYNATNGQMLYRDEYGHPSVESARLSAPAIRAVLTAS